MNRVWTDKGFSGVVVAIVYLIYRERLFVSHVYLTIVIIYIINEHEPSRVFFSLFFQCDTKWSSTLSFFKELGQRTCTKLAF